MIGLYSGKILHWKVEKKSARIHSMRADSRKYPVDNPSRIA
jgi:hypothetical protein